LPLLVPLSFLDHLSSLLAPRPLVYLLPTEAVQINEGYPTIFPSFT